VFAVLRQSLKLFGQASGGRYLHYRVWLWTHDPN